MSRDEARGKGLTRGGGQVGREGHSRGQSPARHEPRGHCGTSVGKGDGSDGVGHGLRAGDGAGVTAHGLAALARHGHQNAARGHVVEVWTPEAQGRLC